MKRRQDDEKTKRLSTLRKHAERVLHEREERFGPLSHPDVKQLADELATHQLELEIQNEEFLSAQMEIESSRRKYAELYNFAPVGYFTLDAAGVVLEANVTGAGMLGTTKRMIIKKPFRVFIENGNDRKKFLKHCREVLRDRLKTACELRLERKGGPSFYAHLESVPFDETDGEGHLFRTVVSDITELRKSEERLLAALKEKETLLRELHHRTKNNMQVIMGLISLQMASVSDKQSVNLLNDIQNRIMSMALVHEKLFRSGDLSRVNLEDYIRDLAGAILSGYQLDENEIGRIIEIDDMESSIDTIIPIGLIINELITNTVKYAFPGRGKREIRISAHFCGKDEIEITYGDNGIGFPPDFDIKETDSLGLKIVYNLVKIQLRGDLTLKRSAKGCTFVIGFKEPYRKKRI